ncbi:glycosyltransferase family 2 protein [Glacieibacterium frigidum]|uniref:Glycosyltransferase n=1 Tax=Glacieibacterium frigidum TaxID=2593303 RepID=A0A552U9I6_9SPHN|nr:glycosyltransferase family 2 protein [Glacieibacterium frigidum]TRW14881.1 glycosyltransferase [Glacieibacterium frigidum]
MSGPRISIVTISFNQARYLGEAIASVLDQGYDNLDYIVVDPGSTDGSRAIVESFGDRLTAVFEPDAGPADGLNRGFARATGEIFGFINADDRLLPGALAKVAAHFADPATDVICGNGVMLDGDGRVTRPIYTSRFSLAAFAHGAMTFVQQANFFTAKAFERAGGFNTANRTCWDAELLVDLALSGSRIVNVPDQLGAFRLYAETITGSGRLAEATRRDLARIAEKALGRPPAAHDAVLRPLHRLLRQVQNPEATFEGVRARLVRR